MRSRKEIFMENTHNISQDQAYKIAGISYLMVFIISIFANSFSLQTFIVPGKAALTATNFTANELFFRLGVAGWLTVIVFDTIVAWALYIVFKQINKEIAVLAVIFRLIFVVIFAGSFINHFSAVQLFTNTHLITAYDPGEIQAQVIQYLNAFNYGTHISFLFFGIHIFLIGYLILKSGYIPKFLGILLTIASLGYGIDSFGNFISASYAENKTAFMLIVAIPAIISEFSFTLWLLYKGFKKPGSA